MDFPWWSFSRIPLGSGVIKLTRNNRDSLVDQVVGFQRRRFEWWTKWGELGELPSGKRLTMENGPVEIVDLICPLKKVIFP